LYVEYPYTEFPGGGASEEIHQYYSLADATRDYPRMEEDWFSYNERYGTPWSLPAGLSFSSVSAIRSRLGCQFYGSDESCNFVAQYDEFIVRFNIRRSAGTPNGWVEPISYEDLSQLLASLDMHIASLIDGEVSLRDAVSPFPSS
jgi:hypothetical protein